MPLKEREKEIAFKQLSLKLCIDEFKLGTVRAIQGDDSAFLMIVPRLASCFITPDELDAQTGFLFPRQNLEECS